MKKNEKNIEISVEESLRILKEINNHKVLELEYNKLVELHTNLINVHKELINNYNELLEEHNSLSNDYESLIAEHNVLIMSLMGEPTSYKM